MHCLVWRTEEKMSLMEYKIRLIVLCLIVMIAGPLSIKPTLADISKDIWNKWWCVLMRWFLVIAVVVAFFPADIIWL